VYIPPVPTPVRIAKAALTTALALTFHLFLGSAISAGARAGQIYDTEIEDTIRVYAIPILRAAGIEPEAVRIHLINSPVLNAFVARGQRIFVTTGLLMTAEHPGQVIGVLAHETGHIAGGHLARLEGAMRDAEIPALLSQLFAAAAGVLARSPEAAVALGTGGDQIVRRSLLQFSRTQESSADRAGLEYLNATHQSAKGLLEFLEILEDQTILTVSRQQQEQISYEMTHPLTRDRILYIQEQVEKSPYSNVPIPPELLRRHARMVAKLRGFMDSPAQTLRRYPETDTSFPAKYARAIAQYRIPNTDKALALVDELIAGAPRDPYLLELKAQILFESGRIVESIPPLNSAVQTLPNAPLIRIALAHAQIEGNDPAMLKSAADNLQRALSIDQTIPLAWQLAASAYGRNGDMGLSALASAEYNYLIGKREDARQMAERAKRQLKNGSPGYLRAEDILEATRRKDNKQR
jgi:predicted Zn-dependent protease